MRRRRILAALPVFLSGCTADRSTPDDDTPTETPSWTRTVSPAKTPTEISTEEPTETPTSAPEYSLIPAEPATRSISEVRASLQNHDCTVLTDDPVVCPGDDSRLSVSLSREIASLPDGSVEISFRNDANETYEWGNHAWQLYKYVDGSWRFLAPFTSPDTLRSLSPGETDSYRVTTEPIEDPGPFSETRLLNSKLGPVSAPELGPGVYGFVNESGYFSEDDPLAVGATFGFAGEGPGVRPTEAAEVVERDDGTLTVRGYVADDNAAFEVSFVDAADVTLLAEHVRFVDPLRNTLAYAASEGIDTIRYVAYEPDVDWAFRYLDAVTPDGTSSYRFRDYRFEVSKTSA